MVDQIAGGNQKTFGNHRKRKTGQTARIRRKKTTETTERQNPEKDR
jgi:hypothetical protein